MAALLGVPSTDPGSDKAYLTKLVIKAAEFKWDPNSCGNLRDQVTRRTRRDIQSNGASDP